LRRISFDPVAQIFDKTRGPPEHVMKQLLNMLAKELSACRTILDAGVGTGRFAKPLQNRAFEVVGIDISQKMLSVAKEKGTQDLFRGDICALPFKDDSFDAAICNAVLHLIPEWKAVLREIRRVTAGVIVSTIHERDNPMRDAYTHLLENHGYKMPKRENPVRDLMDSVTPSKSIHVASYYVDVEKSLSHMNKRVFSFQWSIPESTHTEVMRELERGFSGMRLRQGIRISIWNSDDLAHL